jgi:hypothetical protein
MRPPLSIVHTESSMGWGDQELRVLSEVRGLLARGHAVQLLCALDSRILAEARAVHLPVHALPISKKRPVALKCVVEWLRRNPCHVVSAHSGTDAWLAGVALLALGRPYPMVRTLHATARVRRNSLERWLHTRAATRLVTTSEAQRAELAARPGYRADRIDCVPGLDERMLDGMERAYRLASGRA